MKSHLEFCAIQYHKCCRNVVDNIVIIIVNAHTAGAVTQPDMLDELFDAYDITPIVQTQPEDLPCELLSSEN